MSLNERYSSRSSGNEPIPSTLERLQRESQSTWSTLKPVPRSLDINAGISWRHLHLE
jgi:hypothetical protein